MTAVALEEAELQMPFHLRQRLTPSNDGCWLVATRAKHGYAVVSGGQQAHRFVYEMFIGPVPEGLQLDHLCRRRNCVNPAHLEPVTPRENVLRSEGVAAKRARQTHCKNGHEFTEANTYRYPDGRRECKTCRTEARAIYYAETGR